MEIKGPLLPKKVILLDDITSWTEVNKKHKQAANLTWVEVTVYTAKTKYMINSLHWKNFNELKEALVKGKTRDTEKEKKIYNSIW